MSIALKCFHEHPIVSATFPIDRRAEFTLTIEPQTIDEISRLWQAINAPIRLSAVYRVGVIFLESLEPGVARVVRHPPDFVPPRDIKLLEGAGSGPVLPGAPGYAKTDPTGLATIVVEGAHFGANPTDAGLKIRARSLRPSIDPPLSGQFRATGPETLELRVPLYTPQGRYLLSVWPPKGDRPIAEFWLDVPERIVLIETDQLGFATIIVDDADFTGGVTTVRIDTPPGIPLTETQAASPPAGAFRVVDGETLRVRVANPTATGRHLLTLGRGPNQPRLRLWLEVVP